MQLEESMQLCRACLFWRCWHAWCFPCELQLEALAGGVSTRDAPAGISRILGTELACFCRERFAVIVGHLRCTRFPRFKWWATDYLDHYPILFMDRIVILCYETLFRRGSAAALRWWTSLGHCWPNQAPMGTRCYVSASQLFISQLRSTGERSRALGAWNSPFWSCLSIPREPWKHTYIHTYIYIYYVCIPIPG